MTNRKLEVGEIAVQISTENEDILKAAGWKCRHRMESASLRYLYLMTALKEYTFNYMQHGLLLTTEQLEVLCMLPTYDAQAVYVHGLRQEMWEANKERPECNVTDSI